MLVLICIGLSTLLPQPARSHPHAWIDVSVQVRFDENRRIVALRETWLFDYGYTAFATSNNGLAPGQEADQAFLDALAKENLGNLAAYDYFTVVRRDQSVVPAILMPDTAARLRDGRIEMSFTLRLGEPVDPARDHLTYAVFDPSYYIEMLHTEEQDAIILFGAASNCSHELIRPNPTAEAVALAAALDQAATAEQGFGALFAERVRIRCE